MELPPCSITAYGGPPHLSHLRLPQWMITGNHQLSFSSSTVYLSFFDHAPIMWWHTLIWIKKGIPKHCSLAWVMLLNRSPTRDRLLSWGLQIEHLCLLCNSSSESRNHLYFDCPFSLAVWSHFANRLNISISSTAWDDVTHSLLSLSISRHHKYLSWQASI